MAIAPTGAIYKALIFDGESSRNYGVYITGEAVYNAPQRDVEMISIPGRNGAYALDKGRFQNIEVSYPAGIFADTETNFADAISDFRNFLCSRNGYVRLTDEYNPNEYRMAVYKSGLEVSPAQLKAGQFEITFECKPQRWLTSGETKTTMGAWSDTTTVTDDIVEIDNSDGILSVKDDTVAIEAVQSGSGTPSPSNVRAISGWTDVNVYRTGVNAWDEEWEVGVVTNTGSIDSSPSYSNRRTSTYIPIVPNTDYYLCCSWQALNGRYAYYDSEKNLVEYNSNGFVSNSITTPSDAEYLRITFGTSYGTTYNNDISVNCSSTDTSYHAYNGTTYNIDLSSAGTVYGGTLDVTTGELTVTHAYVKLTGIATWTKSSSYPGGFYIAHQNFALAFGVTPKPSTPFICSHAQTSTTISEYVVGTCYMDNSVNIRIMSSSDTAQDWNDYLDAQDANGTPVEVCVTLATPTTYTLTAQEIELLTGTNYVWADCGDSTIEYGQNPSIIVNPTLFDASPMLEVEGYGTVNVNGYEVEIENKPLGNVQIMPSYLVRLNGQYTTMTSSLSFDSNYVDTGDTITFNSRTGWNPQNVQVKLSASTTIFFNILSGTTTDYAARTSSSSNIENIYGARTSDTDYEWQFLISATSFTVGTASTFTASSTVTMPVTYNGSTANAVFSFSYSLAYDGDATFNITETRGITSDPLGVFSLSDKGFRLATSYAYADSSVSTLGTPTYIDCDLGVVYMIDNGTVIDLNSYVDLGSDLPVLSAGANTITSSGHITDVKVVPRWWKV